MDVLGCRAFRKAIASIGGFDLAFQEFIRISSTSHVASLAKKHDPNELLPHRLTVQLMGSDPEIMARMCQTLVKNGAQHIDLNCGCPSKRVNGRGAGAFLLKEPEHLHRVAKAMVQSVDVPISVKIRSGYDDISLFRENLLAAETAGVSFLTLHPRTKKEGYSPPARWELIREAKEILSIPVVGSGDLFSATDAHAMLNETGCDALMIARGAVINPWIFHEIRGNYEKTWDQMERFFHVFYENIQVTSIKGQLNQLKMIANYLFRGNKTLLGNRERMLREKYQGVESFFQTVLPLLKEGWFGEKSDFAKYG